MLSNIHGVMNICDFKCNRYSLVTTPFSYEAVACNILKGIYFS